MHDQVYPVVGVHLDRLRGVREGARRVAERFGLNTAQKDAVVRQAKHDYLRLRMSPARSISDARQIARGMAREMRA